MSFSVPHLNPLSLAYHYATIKYTWGLNWQSPLLEEGSRTMNATNAIAEQECPRV